MFYAENLPFCMADSNKYIGLINPHVYGSSFFSHNRIPFLAESCIFYRISQSAPFLSSHFSCLISLVYAWRAVRVVPKDPSTRYIHVVNYIGRESFTVKFALTCQEILIEKKRDSWKKEGKERQKDWKGDEWERPKEGHYAEKDDWGEDTSRDLGGREQGEDEFGEGARRMWNICSICCPDFGEFFIEQKAFSWRTPSPKRETCFSFCTFIQVSQLGSNSNLKIIF